MKFLFVTGGIHSARTTHTNGNCETTTIVQQTGMFVEPTISQIDGIYPNEQNILSTGSREIIA